MKTKIGKIKRRRVGDGYEVLHTYTYTSPRFGRSITVYGAFDTCGHGFFSDGATRALDIDSDGWVIHDHMCRYGKWDDGTLIDNWTASTVLADILWAEGYWYRATYWRWATWLMGGGAARRNGMRAITKCSN